MRSSFKKAAKIAAKIIMGFTVERILTVLTRILIDAPMIYLFVRGWNVLAVAIGFIAWCFIYYSAIMYAYDFFSKRGYDLLGLNKLNAYSEKKDGGANFFDRVLYWAMKRRITIFLVGSIFLLDPDTVALLLRKKGERGYRILFYSVSYSIIIWSVIYWLGVKGYGHFSSFLE
jgi:hypothetical protein